MFRVSSVRRTSLASNWFCGSNCRCRTLVVYTRRSAYKPLRSCLAPWHVSFVCPGYWKSRLKIDSINRVMNILDDSLKHCTASHYPLWSLRKPCHVLCVHCVCVNCKDHALQCCIMEQTLQGMYGSNCVNESSVMRFTSTFTSKYG